MDLLSTKNHPFFRRPQGIILLFMLLIISIVCGCLLGSTTIPIQDFISGLLLKEGYASQSIIIYHIRIPRVLASVIAGVGLSVSGVLLQTVTANPLAGPNIIGVNAGAGFVCAIVLSFFPAATASLPIVSFIGAFAATAVILFIAKRVHSTTGTVVLAGIACTTLLNAGIAFLTRLNPDVLISYNAFSVGGLSGVNYQQLIIPCIIVLLCLIVSLIFSRHIQCLYLGDSVAASLGVNVSFIRLICMLCASAAAAAVVSFAGLLGFVGLVVPHIAKRLCGGSTAPLLAVASLVGSILVIIADLIGRTAFAPTEISVGIIMAFIGAPFFFILLMKRRMVYD